jgi:hypothetical protein
MDGKGRLSDLVADEGADGLVGMGVTSPIQARTLFPGRSRELDPQFAERGET